jgi:hypothetical protein
MEIETKFIVNSVLERENKELEKVDKKLMFKFILIM